MNQTSAHQDRPITGLAIRLFAIATLACMFGLVKHANNLGAHIIEIIFYRFVFGAIVTGGWLYYKHGASALKTTRAGGHIVRALVGIVAMSMNFGAFILLPMAEAATIGFTVPLIATIFSVIFLSEYVGFRRWAAVITGFIGVLIAIQPWHNSHLPLVGALVAFTGAAATAGTTIIIRNLSKTESSASILFFYTLLAVPLTGIGMFWFGQIHAIEVYALFLLISILGTIGQLGLSESLRFADVAVIMPVNYSNLIFAGAIGYIFFDQWPQPTLWLGAPLIIGSGIYIALRERKRAMQNANKPENPSPAPKG